MVHYHRSHQPRKTNTDEESQNTVMLDCSTSAYYKRTRPKLLSFLFLITFLSCCYVFAPLFLGPSFPLSLLYSPATENDVNRDGVDANDSPCSSVSTEASQQQYIIRQQVQENPTKKPTLVILSRSGSRAITNENLLVKMAEEIGFLVQVLKPDRTTELAKVYRSLNASDVMIGVHGAAMTHFLFLRPGSVFIQVVPLGTTWAAETYYGEPARKLGLKYIGYQILPRESTLYEKYDKNDPILRDPTSINKKGWEYTKKIYLDSQNVMLDLRRFRKRLHRAYEYTLSKSKLSLQHQQM
ncbi:hypothetical protein JHK84_053414 [Glycine max]|nr:hypothetical protein JHK84_053414 [Glycine max]